jgi:hypothetical protein
MIYDLDIDIISRGGSQESKKEKSPLLDSVEDIMFSLTTTILDILR